MPWQDCCHRYTDTGLEGLTDRSRKPSHQARQLPFQIESEILSIKREHPIWGDHKIREKLRRQIGGEVPFIAISIVHAALDRHDLVKRSRQRRCKAEGAALSIPTEANDLWCADYNGKFILADGRYCDPLTVTDFANRYLIGCEALSNT